MATKVMSWNIWDFNRPATPAERERAVIDHIGRVEPDILLLQEFCDDGTDANGNARFAAVRQELGLEGRLAFSTDSRFHTAVLWRPELTEIGPWVTYDESFWHAIGVTTLEVTPGRLLRIGSVHLSPKDADSRLADTERFSWLGGDAELPTILAGDWNNLGEDAAYDPEPRVAPEGEDRRADRRVPSRLTDAGLLDVAPELGAAWAPTFGHLRPEGDDPGVRIDAFRATASALTWIRGYRVDATSSDASDHRPILIELDPTDA